MMDIIKLMFSNEAYDIKQKNVNNSLCYAIYLFVMLNVEIIYNYLGTNYKYMLLTVIVIYITIESIIHLLIKKYKYKLTYRIITIVNISIFIIITILYKVY